VTAAPELFEEVQERHYDAALMRRLLHYLRPYRNRALVAVLMLLAGAVLALVGPALTQRALDVAVPHRDVALLGTLAAMFVLALLLEFALDYGQTLLTAWIGQRVMSDLRLELFTHLQGLSISYFDRNPVGRLMTRITSDVETLNELFSSGLVTVFGDVFTLIAIMTMMLVVDWRLALVAFAVIPFMLLVAAVFRRSVREAFRDIRIRVARINGFLQEHLSGMRVVQLFGREEVTARQFAVINKDHLSAHLRSITVYALFFPAVEFLGSVALGALLWYGGLRVLDQTMTVGILAAFIQLTRRFFQPLQDLAEKYNLLQSAMASSERIFRLMDTQPTVLEPAHPKRLARPVRGEVVFEDVWFRYGSDRVPSSEFRVAESDEPTSNELGTRNSELPTENWVLKGVSFTARPDQTLAIVGHTGAGKTTIISLLLRFYDPQRGRITLDGVDLRELPLAQLRELVGFVQQDLFLFTGDILHNLTLDAPISPERAHEAAARVGADRFVNRLPDTYAHILGERGRNLSVGERQLLSFARALARDPRILVLDEATSSVDAEAEAQIQAALAELMRGRTTLVVAHRLSTILHANEILVLHHGEVAERGSHRELLARKGLYERLYRLQLRGPTREHRVGV
jgi:ATP-binding cassette subfamily B protein